MLDPVAFSVGPLSVRWYGLLIGFGVLMGVYLAVREGKRFNLDADLFYDILFVGLPSALIGARLYYVLFNIDQYDSVIDAIAIWNGGIAIHGALIGALLGGAWMIRRRGYSFARIADICAPSLIVGQIIGRWGNFMNQEAYGSVVSQDFLSNTLLLPDWIVGQMLIKGAYHHPTFLYESVWTLIGILLLFWLRRRPWLRAGELMMSYLVWYSIGRFYIEGFRTDSLTLTLPEPIAAFFNGLWAPLGMFFEQGALPDGNVRAAQLIGLVIILALITIMIYRRKRVQLAMYSDPIQSVLQPSEKNVVDSTDKNVANSTSNNVANSTSNNVAKSPEREE